LFLSYAQVIFSLDTLGTIAFAISGALAAMQKKLDLFGVFVIAFVTSIGGGTLRDLLIGNQPVAWLTSTFTFSLITCCVVVTVLGRKLLVRARQQLFLFDAVGLGVFTIIGIDIALAHNLPYPSSVMMGLFSAVFGGVLRDTLCNEVPLIFREELYATPCVVGGLIYVAAHGLGISGITPLLATVFCVVLIRILALYFHLRLPTINLE